MPLELNTYLPPIVFSTQSDEDGLRSMLSDWAFVVECTDGRQYEGEVREVVYDDDPRCPTGQSAVVISLYVTDGVSGVGDDGTVVVALPDIARFVYL